MARRALPVHAELSSVMAQRARSPDHEREAESHQPSVSTANSSISLPDGFRDLHGASPMLFGVFHESSAVGTAPGAESEQ